MNLVLLVILSETLELFEVSLIAGTLKNLMKTSY
jgi:hypothetical protein